MALVQNRPFSSRMLNVFTACLRQGDKKILGITEAQLTRTGSNSVCYGIYYICKGSFHKARDLPTMVIRITSFTNCARISDILGFYSSVLETSCSIVINVLSFGNSLPNLQWIVWYQSSESIQGVCHRGGECMGDETMLGGSAGHYFVSLHCSLNYKFKIFAHPSR